MLINFTPHYTLTSKIVTNLLKIEAAKEKVLHLPLTPTVLATLRETARLYTTHYSTMIEGNQLDAEQVGVVVKHEGHFPGRERDESEVRGYYAALEQVEQWVAQGISITEKSIQILHALVMNNGKFTRKASPYRDGQNAIRDRMTRTIIYMPPEAKDVPLLMKALIKWINTNKNVPCPIVAGIVHYQFATIHPYYDGNGRTARLLTTLILHLGGYDLKGLYSIEEYYARNLGAYYEAISIGPSHNYYMGRADADITKWIEYFIEGMATSFENVLQRMSEAKARKQLDVSGALRALDPKQRKALELFQEFAVVTSHQLGELFGFKPRTSAQLCYTWVKDGFLEPIGSSKKGRKYRLTPTYEAILRQDTQ